MDDATKKIDNTLNTPNPSFSSGYKEAPNFSALVSETRDELVKLSEKEPEIPQEVKDAGIEFRSELPNLGQEHQQAGLSYSEPTPRIPNETTSKFLLPVLPTALDLAKKVKNSPSFAISWIARLLEIQQKRASQGGKA